MNKGKICHIREICKAINNFQAEFESRFELNINEAMLLCTLMEEGKLTSGEIAEKLELSNSNTSKIIHSLEKKSYIHRISDQEDRRRMIFTLTESGQEKLFEVKCSEIAIPDLLCE